MANPNPVVYRAPCINCGLEVALFERDAEDYLAGPSYGLAHFDCEAALEATRGHFERSGGMSPAS